MNDGLLAIRRQAVESPFTSSLMIQTVLSWELKNLQSEQWNYRLQGSRCVSQKYLASIVVVIQ
jgi:hypothetical protein